MFGFLKSPPFTDPQLGDLHRKGGRWRGSLVLGDTQVPLALSGSRGAPDGKALTIARSITSGFPSWREAVAAALFEHYSPYGEAVAAGDVEAPSGGLPRIDRPDDVWRYAHAKYVQVALLDGRLTIEIGYRVDWDEEHTLGARIRDAQLIELCGSVLAP